MEELKKENENKPESELTEKLNTEFPLSGGETDEDLENVLKKNDDEQEEQEENTAP